MLSPFLFEFSAAVLAHSVGISLIGAICLFVSSQSFHVQPPSLLRSWKVYLLAVAWGLLLVALLGNAVGWRQENAAEWLAWQCATPCLTQFLVLCYLLRQFSLRPLLAQGVAVLVTNLLTTVLFSTMT